jgi:hypothetical protein
MGELDKFGNIHQAGKWKVLVFSTENINLSIAARQILVANVGD